MGALQRVLVTGAEGLLGSTLVKTLSDQYDVTAWADDICDTVLISKLKEGTPYDFIIHTAALTNVDTCEEDQLGCYHVNIQGTRNMLSVSRAHNARFVYISTVSVFSGIEGNYTELDVPYPGNYYNLSKFVSEELVKDYELGLSLRVNIIGIHPAGSRGRNFLEWFVDGLACGRDMQLFADVRINPLSNYTLAELIKEFLSLPLEYPCVHLGSRTILSKADIGRLVMESIGHSNSQVTFVDSGSLSGRTVRPKNMTLNVTLAEEILGRKLPTLEYEVKRAIECYN